MIKDIHITLDFNNGDRIDVSQNRVNGKLEPCGGTLYNHRSQRVETLKTNMLFVPMKIGNVIAMYLEHTGQ